MKVFTNHTDTVVAEDLADVQRVIEEQYGDGVFEQENWSLDDWTEVRPDKRMTIHNVEDNGGSETRTAAEWAKQMGRGLLCSTEW